MTALAIAGARVGDVRGFAWLPSFDSDVSPGRSDLPPVAPARVTLGLGMGAVMADWIAASLTGTRPRVAGAVATEAGGAIAFTDALLTRLEVPALDRTDDAPGALVLRVEPQHLRRLAGATGIPEGRRPTPRPWQRRDFRVEVSGLPCDHVLRVEPLVGPFGRGRSRRQCPVGRARPCPTCG